MPKGVRWRARELTALACPLAGWRQPTPVSAAPLMRVPVNLGPAPGCGTNGAIGAAVTGLSGVVACCCSIARTVATIPKPLNSQFRFTSNATKTGFSTNTRTRISTGHAMTFTSSRARLNLHAKSRGLSPCTATVSADGGLLRPPRTELCCYYAVKSSASTPGVVFILEVIDLVDGTGIEPVTPAV